MCTRWVEVMANLVLTILTTKGVESTLYIEWDNKHTHDVFFYYYYFVFEFQIVFFVSFFRLIFYDTFFIMSISIVCSIGIANMWGINNYDLSTIYSAMRINKIDSILSDSKAKVSHRLANVFRDVFDMNLLIWTSIRR